MILLLTGAIDIGDFGVPSTTIVDVDQRLKQYLQSIDYAITEYKTISKIVFCENTGFDYDYTSLKKKAINLGKTLEILSFKGDYNEIKQKGKGYGEGEIIDYALKSSKTLIECEAFYKLTGRLIVANMDKIVATTLSDNSFIFHPKLIYAMPVDHIETYFYKTSKELYISRLIDSYQEVDESKFRFLEHIFYERLSNFNIRSFKIAPIINGYSGTSGEHYNEGFKSQLFERICCFIGVHNLKKSFSEKISTKVFLYLLKIRRLLK